MPLIFLNLMQYESLIGTPNPAYRAIPLLLILLYCPITPARKFFWYSFCLIYTGFGLFMGLVTIGVFARSSHTACQPGYIWRLHTLICRAGHSGHRIVSGDDEGREPS
jgi:hypothetical protein